MYISGRSFGANFLQEMKIIACLESYFLKVYGAINEAIN